MCSVKVLTQFPAIAEIGNAIGREIFYTARLHTTNREHSIEKALSLQAVVIITPFEVAYY